MILRLVCMSERQRLLCRWDVGSSDEEAGGEHEDRGSTELSCVTGSCRIYCLRLSWYLWFMFDSNTRWSHTIGQKLSLPCKTLYPCDVRVISLIQMVFFNIACMIFI